MANVKVFEPNLGNTIARAVIPAGLSKAAETRILRAVRVELKALLTDVAVSAFGAGGFGISSGKALKIMQRGVRVYGTTFVGLQGYILGPYYVRRMEEGGIITPKNAQYLAIPMPAALRPDGSSKLPGPRSWQNIKKTFVWKNKENKLFIVYKNPKTAQYPFTFLYHLADEAIVKRNPALSRAWNNRKGRLIRTVGRAMHVEFSKDDLLSRARITHKGKK
jgi:hypothetical protein